MKTETMAAGIAVEKDMYGRGFDGLFGKGGQTQTNRQALLKLKAIRDSRSAVKEGDIIDHDIYGRADPRLFGLNAHVANQNQAASALVRSQRPEKKSLKAIMFPARKFLKTRGLLRRLSKSPTKLESDATQGDIRNADGTSKVLRVKSRLPNQEERPVVLSGIVARGVKSFDSESNLSPYLSEELVDVQGALPSKTPVDDTTSTASASRLGATAAGAIIGGSAAAGIFTSSEDVDPFKDAVDEVVSSFASSSASISMSSSMSRLVQEEEEAYTATSASTLSGQEYPNGDSDASTKRDRNVVLHPLENSSSPEASEIAMTSSSEEEASSEIGGLSSSDSDSSCQDAEMEDASDLRSETSEVKEYYQSREASFRNAASVPQLSTALPQVEDDTISDYSSSVKEGKESNTDSETGTEKHEDGRGLVLAAAARLDKLESSASDDAQSSSSTLVATYDNLVATHSSVAEESEDFGLESKECMYTKGSVLEAAAQLDKRASESRDDYQTESQKSSQDAFLSESQGSSEHAKESSEAVTIEDSDADEIGLDDSDEEFHDSMSSEELDSSEVESESESSNTEDEFVENDNVQPMAA